MFKEGRDSKSDGNPLVFETLGEHIFVQLKSVKNPDVNPFSIFARGNVEKAREMLDRKDKVAELDTYPFQLDMSELVTVERMGIGVPVLLVIADLARSRCSFVCLNDYIDKILVPKHEDYRTADSRTIHVPLWTEIGTDVGTIAIRWYAKRAKLLAAFQRFAYQYHELQWPDNGDWRTLARYFGERIKSYDFWDDTEMCAPIAYHAQGLRRFLETGQPGYFKPAKDLPKEIDPEKYAADISRADVFELWRLLALLPKTYEDVWREWFLPTSLGHLSSAP